MIAVNEVVLIFIGTRNHKKCVCLRMAEAFEEVSRKFRDGGCVLPTECMS